MSKKLRTPQTVSAVRSLPARISMIVFGATLLTSLVVTAISVHSIDSFLRDKIEQNFPAVLASADERLDLWYDQRLLELGVFASSGILTESAPFLLSGARDVRAHRASAEIGQYLQYVLDSFPQYDALFVLGADDQPLLWVGTEFTPPPGLLSSEGSSTEASLSRAIETKEGFVQVASIHIGDGQHERGTLHAVLRLESVGEILLGENAASQDEIFMLDAKGGYLIASPERLARGSFTDPHASDGTDEAVVDYFNEEGERVVGCTRELSRFGWKLALERPYSEAFAPVVAGIRRILGINLAIVLLFALGAFRIAGSIARPIEALSDAARRISEGEKGVSIPDPRSRDEVGVLAQTLSIMTRKLETNADELEDSHAETEQAVERMRQQYEELQRVNEILEQLSITDGLTTLHNHRYFQEHLTKEAKRASRTGEPLALVMIDIDHFKMWNDRLGHSGGDNILRRIAEIMQQLTRETDLLARYGGEEFALLLPNTELEGAIRLAEKIRGTVAETRFFIDPPSERQPVTVSVGVSTFSGDKRTLFDEADQALYRAKASGRDCVMIAEESPPTA